MGVGPRPSGATLVALSGVDAAAGGRELVDGPATRHVLRLAAGLESVVVGEDQVLQQLRGLRRTCDGAPRVGGRLVGLLDTAIHLGRRARAERPRSERSLAGRAVSWLASQLGTVDGARVLVVGSGPIGRDAALLATRAGARVTTASRSPRRGATSTLPAAARSLPGFDGAVVALAGPWSDLLEVPPPDAPASSLLMADLSDPPAIPGPWRARLGERLATLDDLASAGASDDTVTAAYVRHAEELVEATILRFTLRDGR
jgi:glutamyl-tRNA reductase